MRLLIIFYLDCILNILSVRPIILTQTLNRTTGEAQIDRLFPAFCFQSDDRRAHFPEKASTDSKTD